MKNETPTTLIKSIEIINLFDIFNYKIEYPSSEKVLIITGPNGFGKTQVLNIIFNLFNRKFSFFKKLVFNKITICLSDNVKIDIIKSEATHEKELQFEDEEIIKNKSAEKNIR